MNKPKLDVSKELLIEIIKSEKPVKKYKEFFGIHATRYYQELRKYDIAIKFTRDELKKEIESHVSRVGKIRASNDLRIHNNTLSQFQEGCFIQNPVLIRFLNYYDIAYRVILTPNKKEEGVWKEVFVQANLTSLREAKMDTPDITKVSQFQMNYLAESEQLLLNHRTSLLNMLESKEVSVSIINQVLDKFDMGCRESALIGIMSERIGKGKKMESTIYKKITTI